jgi:putative ABC transport system substrate-binding protein
MRRREFITLLGSAAVAWPLAARAQQQSMPVIGFLSRASADNRVSDVAAFKRGLQEAGFAEGQNVVIDYRWADDQIDRLPAMAADLVRRQVALIVAYGNFAVRPAKAATSTIPIVFAGGFDPIEIGVIASLNQPGGNITGVSFFANALDAKRLGLLRLVIPKATVIGALLNPDNASAAIQARDLQAAARSIGVQLQIANASGESDFDRAFAGFVQQGAGGLLVGTDGFFQTHRMQLVALAARYAIPAIYQDRDMATAGGLMSYGASQNDAFRQAGIYAGRILKGEKPGDLPVQLPTKFELVINLKSAKMLGLTIPDGLLLAADEVIE